MNVVETLQAEHAELTTKLTELDERIKTERPALVAQLSQVKKAISALTGTTTRKPITVSEPSALAKKPVSAEKSPRTN